MPAWPRVLLLPSGLPLTSFCSVVFFFVLSRFSGFFFPPGAEGDTRHTHSPRQQTPSCSQGSAAYGPRPPTRCHHGGFIVHPRPGGPWQLPSPVFLPGPRTPPVWGTHPSELGISGEYGHILGHSFIGMPSRICHPSECTVVALGHLQPLRTMLVQAEPGEAPATSRPCGLPPPSKYRLSIEDYGGGSLPAPGCHNRARRCHPTNSGGSSHS